VALQNQQAAPPATGQAFDANAYSAGLVKFSADWLANKLSTAGTGAELREVGRQKLNGDLLVHYRVFVQGASKDQLYQLLQWPTDSEKPFVTFRGLSIATDGLVMSQDNPVDFTFHPTKGEPYRLALMSSDGSTKVYFGVVPDPIMASDKNCTLEVIGMLPKLPLVMIRAKGYKPNEELQFTSHSYKEAHDTQAKSDADGAFVMALLTKVKGKETGKTEVELKGAECAPKLAFEWGK
jgi:hypothetical protein